MRSWYTLGSEDVGKEDILPACTPSAHSRSPSRGLSHSPYTAIAGLTLPSSTAWLVLTVVWIGAMVGAALQLVRGFAARWLSAGPYLALGWVAVAVVPQLAETLGRGGFALLLGGALLYSVGALVYARKRRDPRPLVFGYHEVFHLLVTAAAAAHYATVAGFVLPRL
jgi:hemolysin III